MSGMISGASQEDPFHRYKQRLNEIIQPNTNKSHTLTSIGSLSESVFGGQSNNKGRLNNGTLPANQFYSRNYNQEQLQANNITSNRNLLEGSSVYTGASDASVFKRPLPVKQIISWSHYDRKLDLLRSSLRSIDDKATLKFMMTAMETLVHTCLNPPCPRPVNPEVIIDHVCHLVKEEYFSKRVPKSICGSSVMSDQASNIDQYAGNSERSIRLDKPSASSVVSEYSSAGRVGLSSYQQQELSRIEASRRQHVETLIDNGSTYNILDDSEIARRRDEAAARRGDSAFGTSLYKKNVKTIIKSTPKSIVNSSKQGRPTKGSTKVNNKPTNRNPRESLGAAENNNNLDRESKNASVLNGTTNGVSRCGRTLKPPVKYWNSKDDESSHEENDESTLNQSMTLRNKKVVDKKKTPTVQNNKNKRYTPTLTALKENKEPTSSSRKRGRPPAKGKENVSEEKKKPVKKQAETPAVKKATSKGKPNKKNEETITQKTEKSIIKKPAPKRKSKDTNDSKSKKKKIEDSTVSDGDEDIFGAPSYRKPAHQNLKMVLSPSTALLSAKKAAGEAEGKATPPCKAIGDMMTNESMVSTMSAPRELPRQNEATKRVIKKMEKKDQMKPPAQLKSKVQVKKHTKEDTQLNDLIEAVKSSYSVNNSQCSATLTVFRGKEMESDESFMDEDEDNDDLL